MAEPVLQVEKLKIYYYTLRGIVRAVDGVGFTLGKGEVLGIAGESGCGKSTLAYGLLRLVPPPGRITGGRILIDGVDIVGLPEPVVRKKFRWTRISMVFQAAMNALNPVYTVGYQIAEPLMYHKGMPKKEALEEARRLIQLMGLPPSIADRYPHELSGGQKQRVVIAMALALKPDIVIADEPTTALDVVVQAQILNLLKKLKMEIGMSLILISHDLSIIAEMADKIAIMYAGKIVEYGDSIKVFTNPLHPYTRGLIAAVPDIRAPKGKLSYIPGSPPDLRRPPKGCRFHPRCSRAGKRCMTEEPPLIEVEKDHYVACWLYA
ncbi:MAG: ABC transporter ATP-binding protein [Crenarchaeota archaeon]|nr:ABC transporter ATP-binding protein [Thermoproteota archaeon]